MKKTVFYLKSGLFFVFASIVSLFFALPLVALYKCAEGMVNGCEWFLGLCDDIPGTQFGEWFTDTIDKYFDNGKFKRYEE